MGLHTVRTIAAFYFGEITLLHFVTIMLHFRGCVSLNVTVELKLCERPVKYSTTRSTSQINPATMKNLDDSHYTNIEKCRSPIRHTYNSTLFKHSTVDFLLMIVCECPIECNVFSPIITKSHIILCFHDSIKYCMLINA